MSKNLKEKLTSKKAIIAYAVMAVLLVGGCGNADTNNNSTSNNTTEKPVAEKPIEKEVAEVPVVTKEEEAVDVASDTINYVMLSEWSSQSSNYMKFVAETSTVMAGFTTMTDFVDGANLILDSGVVDKAIKHFDSYLNIDLGDNINKANKLMHEAFVLYKDGLTMMKNGDFEKAIETITNSSLKIQEGSRYMDEETKRIKNK